MLALAVFILLRGDIMKIKSLLYILLIQCTIFLTALLSPSTDDITGKDFKISCMDKLLPRIFQLELPNGKSIRNFRISFTNAKVMGRTAIIEIWFDSELYFNDVEKMIFKNNTTKLFREETRNANSVVYTDDYAKYKVIYMNNKSYCIHISKKVEADK